MDFEHFRETGKSVTGYVYEAWKFGPVPVDLMEEWEEFEEDLSALVEIVPEKVIDFTRETVKVKAGVEFNEDDFTSRQLRIIEELAGKYKDTRSPAMIDVTHQQNGAWDKVWAKGAGAQQEIPYELAILPDAKNREAVMESAAESHGFATALADGEY